MHGTVAPPSKPNVLRRLLDDVIGGGDAVLLADPAEARAVLDEAAADLAEQRTRALRVRADIPGGLGVTELLAQLGGRRADCQDDRDLQQSFRALTVLDPACDRIALLVSDAHALQPSALRYIQLACRSSEHLRLVFAGTPGLLELLDDPAFTDLAARLERTPLALAAPIVAMPMPGSPAPRAAARIVARQAAATPVMPFPVSIGDQPISAGPPSSDEAPASVPVLAPALATPVSPPVPPKPLARTSLHEPVGRGAGPRIEIVAPTRPPRAGGLPRTGRRTGAALGLMGLLLLGMVIGRHGSPVAVTERDPAPKLGQPMVAEPVRPAPAPSSAAPLLRAESPAVEPVAVAAVPAQAPASPPVAQLLPAPVPVPASVPAAIAPPEPDETVQPASPPVAPPPMVAAAAPPEPVAAPVHQLPAPAPSPVPPASAEAAGPRARVVRQAVRHDPPRTLAHAARLGPVPREDEGWVDYYGRPVPRPPDRPLRYPPIPFEGWGQPAERPYIGTFRPGAGGARSFSYGD